MTLHPCKWALVVALAQRIHPAVAVRPSVLVQEPAIVVATSTAPPDLDRQLGKASGEEPADKATTAAAAEGAFALAPTMGVAAKKVLPRVKEFVLGAKLVWIAVAMGAASVGVCAMYSSWRDSCSASKPWGCSRWARSPAKVEKETLVTVRATSGRTYQVVNDLKDGDPTMVDERHRFVSLGSFAPAHGFTYVRPASEDKDTPCDEVQFSLDAITAVTVFLAYYSCRPLHAQKRPWIEEEGWKVECGMTLPTHSRLGEVINEIRSKTFAPGVIRIKGNNDKNTGTPLVFVCRAELSMRQLPTGTIGGVASSSGDAFDWASGKRAFSQHVETFEFWQSKMGLPAWLQYRFTSPQTVGLYSIVARHPDDELIEQDAPKDFTFYGSNDGICFTILDTRSGVTGWRAAGSHRKAFVVHRPAPYRIYRLVVTATGGRPDGAAFAVVAQLEFFAARGAVRLSEEAAKLAEPPIVRGLEAATGPSAAAAAAARWAPLAPCADPQGLAPEAPVEGSGAATDEAVAAAQKAATPAAQQEADERRSDLFFAAVAQATRAPGAAPAQGGKT